MVMSRPRARGAAATLAVLATSLTLTGCGDAASTGAPATSPEVTVTDAPSVPATSPAAPTTAPAGTSALDTTGDVALAGTSALSEPVSGSTVPGPRVTVAGTGTAFEATMVWDVHPAGDLTGAPVAQGSTHAGANGEVGSFAFTVDLPAGSWTVRVWEPDMRDGGTEPGASSHLVRTTFRVG